MPHHNLLNFAAGCVTALIFGCASPPDTTAPESLPDYSAMALEINTMAAAEQKVRRQLVAWMQAHPGENPPGDITAEMTTLDRAHSARVKEIIDDIGWPTTSKVGAQASSDAWLIIQHAGHDLPLMQRSLTLMEPHFGTGEIDDQNYALLYDRVNLYQNRPQRYGTQGATLVIDGITHHGLHPIEDVEHVDERRAQIGLSPLADYLRMLRMIYGVPAGEPDFPIDITMDEFYAIKAKMQAAEKNGQH